MPASKKDEMTVTGKGLELKRGDGLRYKGDLVNNLRSGKGECWFPEKREKDRLGRVYKTTSKEHYSG